MLHAILRNAQLIWAHTWFPIFPLVLLPLTAATAFPILGAAIFPEMKKWVKSVGYAVNAVLLFCLSTYLGGDIIGGRLSNDAEVKNLRVELLGMKMDEAARSLYIAKLDEKDFIFNTLPNASEARTWLAEAKERFPQK